MSYSNKLEMKPYSDKYKRYFNNCFSNQYNCAEGAYRAGKSVINILSFANYLDYCKDKIHLASGATSSTARLNIADCNGYGLNYLFRGRCKTGKYEGNECLKIKSKTGEKIVIFVGGSQSDSYKKIQGLSFGSWISVELANLYISDDEKCFIDMAISRLTQSKDLKVWWDLNPVYPSHKVYTKYLDKYQELDDKGEFYGGFNYEKFSLFDNDALSDEAKKSFVSKYPDKESMEYRRYILGDRACAEGLIFSLFAKDKSMWLVNDIKEFTKSLRPQFVSIGVDFGGNGSNTAFCATLIYNNYQGVFPFADDEINMNGGENDVSVFRERFKDFLYYAINSGVGDVRYIYGDCAEKVLIAEMRSVLKELGLYGKIRVLDSKKQTIKKRIDTKKMLMNKKCWHVSCNANFVINSTATQVWDKREGHEDERLDNGSCDIDIADAEEYSWSAFLDKLIANCR